MPRHFARECIADMATCPLLNVIATLAAVAIICLSVEPSQQPSDANSVHTRGMSTVLGEGATHSHFQADDERGRLAMDDVSTVSFALSAIAGTWWSGRKTPRLPAARCRSISRKNESTVSPRKPLSPLLILPRRLLAVFVFGRRSALHISASRCIVAAFKCLCTNTWPMSASTAGSSDAMEAADKIPQCGHATAASAAFRLTDSELMRRPCALRQLAHMLLAS